MCRLLFPFGFHAAQKPLKFTSLNTNNAIRQPLQPPYNRTAKHAPPITVAQYCKAINFRPKARQIRTKANGRHKTNRYFKER
jgi:hypothetical protein